MLGFASGTVHSAPPGTSTSTALPIVLDDVLCTGTEDNLWECPRNAINTHNCGHHDDVWVQCHGGSPAPISPHWRYSCDSGYILHSSSGTVGKCLPDGSRRMFKELARAGSDPASQPVFGIALSGATPNPLCIVNPIRGSARSVPATSCKDVV